MLQAQQQNRATGQQEFAIERMSLPMAQLWPVGIQQAYPVVAFGDIRQAETDCVVVGVEQQKQRVVVPGAVNAGGLGSTVEEHAEAAGMGGLPLFFGHWLTGWGQPTDIVDAQLFVVLADQKATATQDRIAL